MKKLILAVIVALGVTTAATAQSTIFNNVDNVTKENLTKIVPAEYKLLFDNTSYTYYKKGEEVLAFTFKKGRVTSVIFSDVSLIAPIKNDFESWKAEPGRKICVVDNNDFIVWQIEKGKQYALFNKNNL